MGDRYPHCLLVLESVQELFNMPDGHGRLGKGNLGVNYLDTIILRMQNGTDNWYRNHFPVIFETSKSHYFAEDVYNDIQQPEYFIPTVEFTGYSEKQRQENMAGIFNPDQLDQVNKTIGKSIYFLNVFTE